MLLDWVDARLDWITPSLVADWVTTGPSPWSVRVGADGRWSETNGEYHHLPEREKARLWSTVEQARFFELPDTIGKSPSPDTPFRFFALRTRSGVKRVRVFRELAEDSPMTKEQRGRAVRVWATLPGEHKPLSLGSPRGGRPRR